MSIYYQLWKKVLFSFKKKPYGLQERILTLENKRKKPDLKLTSRCIYYSVSQTYFRILKLSSVSRLSLLNNALVFSKDSPNLLNGASPVEPWESIRPSPFAASLKLIIGLGHPCKVWKKGFTDIKSLDTTETMCIS